MSTVGDIVTDDGAPGVPPRPLHRGQVPQRAADHRNDDRAGANSRRESGRGRAIHQDPECGRRRGAGVIARARGASSRVSRPAAVRRTGSSSNACQLQREKDLYARPLHTHQRARLASFIFSTNRAKCRLARCFNSSTGSSQSSMPICSSVVQPS